MLLLVRMLDKLLMLDMLLMLRCVEARMVGLLVG